MSDDAANRHRFGTRDLIASGVVSAPLRLVRTYRGQELEARLLEDGTVQFRGEVYPSLSAAAVAAIQSTRPDGEGSAINGWEFWRYTDSPGRASRFARSSIAASAASIQTHLSGSSLQGPRLHALLSMYVSVFIVSIASSPPLQCPAAAQSGEAPLDIRTTSPRAAPVRTARGIASDRPELDAELGSHEPHLVGPWPEATVPAARTDALTRAQRLPVERGPH